MASSLDSVAGVSDQKQKIEQYKAALKIVLDSGSAQECKDFIDHSEYSLSMDAVILLSCNCS